MSRDVTAAIADALAKSGLHAEWIADLEFDSGHLRAWTGLGDLSWGGNTFEGVGHLGTISPVEETSELKATGMAFQLSGVPTSLLATALGEHYQGNQARAWVAFFDDGMQLINDPIPIFAGRMDTMQINETGATATITLNAENRLIAFERINQVLYYTDQIQQQLYPGDLGLQYVPEMQEAEIHWGREKLDTSTGNPTKGTAPGAMGAPGDVNGDWVAEGGEGGDPGIGGPGPGDNGGGMGDGVGGLGPDTA